MTKVIEISLHIKLKGAIATIITRLGEVKLRKITLEKIKRTD